MQSAIRLLISLIVTAALGCENKAAEPVEEPATAEQEDVAVEPPHADPNREALKAAGRAKEAIEKKGEERNARVDEAMKAGQ